jgi:hypothetical protein
MANYFDIKQYLEFRIKIELTASGFNFYINFENLFKVNLRQQMDNALY